VKLRMIDPPRSFQVGLGIPITLKDCAHLYLDPDEQITLVTESGAEFDVTRKSWGFYATPSLNGRLEQFGLRGLLVRSANGRYFVLLVEKGHEEEFESYRQAQQLEVVMWLDSSESLEQLRTRMGATSC